MGCGVRRIPEQLGDGEQELSVCRVGNPVGNEWLELAPVGGSFQHGGPRGTPDVQDAVGDPLLVGQHHRTFDASKRDSVVPERGRVGLAFEQGVIEQIALQHQTRQCEVVADTLDEFVRQLRKAPEVIAHVHGRQQVARRESPPGRGHDDGSRPVGEVQHPRWVVVELMYVAGS